MPDPIGKRKMPWTLVAVFGLLTLGILTLVQIVYHEQSIRVRTLQERGPTAIAGLNREILLFSAGCIGLIVLCGVLLGLFWRRQLAAHEEYEKTKWDKANANMREFLQLIIDIMPNPAFFKDAGGRYLGCNPAFEKLLGLSKGEILNKALPDLAPDEIARQHMEHDEVLLKSPGHRVYEAPLRAWDGDHHVIFIKSTFAWPDGRLGGIIGILKDITQRRRAEEELEQLRRFSDGTVQTMTEGLVLTDSEGKFVFVNPAAADMLGRRPEEMIEKTVKSFVPKDHHHFVDEADERRARGVSDRYELDFLHRDGSRRTVLVSGGPRLQGAQAGGTMAVLTDITDLKRMESEVRALSLTDDLTHLYNRRGFMTLAEQQLKIAWRLNKKVAVLYFDMDDLKIINDSRGHKEGDRALVDVATLLKKNFREADLVGRMGGDEFVVMAMETTRLNPGTLTKRLQEKLDVYNSRAEAEKSFKLSLSVGVAIYDPQLPSTIDDLVNRADLLMYEDKRRKKTS